MKTTFVSRIAVLVAAVFVAACGGGGGGGAPTPTPTASPPTAALLSVSPATGATVKANTISDIAITVDLTVIDATRSDASKASLLCDNNPISFTSASSLSADGKTMSLTLTPKAVTALVGATYQCTLSGDIVTTGPGGTVTTTGSTSFGVTSTCTAPAVWTQGINTCVKPLLVAATGFYKIPANCTSAVQSCFKDSVSQMSAVDGGVDSSGDSITYLAFLNNSGYWNVLPFHTKDGTRAGPDITGGYAVELDTFWGAGGGGVITHQKGVQSWVCWNISEVGQATQVTCPTTP